ncbi:MAG: hypothetical protein J7494_13120 [Sphingobium sp.]|nr:hypothetical protein [Sphingobium sp.]
MRFQHLILAMGTATVVGMATPATAAMDVTDAMSLCSRITKADARIECYDQVARDVAAGVFQKSAAPAPQTYAPAAAAQPNWATPPSSVAPAQRPQVGTAAPAVGFGAENVRNNGGGNQAGPDSIKAEVASSTDNGLQQWRFRLADGAIWQMTERVSLFRPPAPHEVVTIKKGALGGFMMDVGQQASVRVRRIQ